MYVVPQSSDSSAIPYSFLMQFDDVTGQIQRLVNQVAGVGLPVQALDCQEKQLDQGAALLQMFNEQSLEFQEKIMQRSGLGDETYLPEGVYCS